MNASMNTGITPKARSEIVGKLSVLLADTFTLYLKTHFYHWNVTGPQFQTLHLMFETQYNELWLATDLIAERIRSLGEEAPGSYAAYSKLTNIKESTRAPNAEQMIKDLVEGHECVTRVAREMFPMAEKANDEVTADLLTQRMQIHEKTAWMLRSLFTSPLQSSSRK